MVFNKSDNQILIAGTPLTVMCMAEGADLAPGLFVKKGTSDYEIKLADAGDKPWAICMEYFADDVMPGDTYDDDARVRVAFGPGSVVKARLASGQNVATGAFLVPAADGTLQAAAVLTVDSGETPVTSGSANGAIIGGDIGDGYIIAQAVESVDASGAEAWIAVKLLI